MFNLIMCLSKGKYTQYTAGKDKYDFKGKKVLLAEDNDFNREIAMEILKSAKLDVIPAIDGKDAIEKYKANKEDLSLVLLDIQMPEYDGYEVAKMIRALGDDTSKNMPIVDMTANPFAEDIAKALNSGMNDHIAKPINTEVMFQAISKNIK